MGQSTWGEFAAGNCSSTMSSSPVLIRMLVISMALSGAIAFATTADTVVPEGFDVQLDEHQDPGFDMVSQSQNQPQPSTYEVVDESEELLQPSTYEVVDESEELLQQKEGSGEEGSGEELIQQEGEWGGSGEEGSGEELLQQQEGEWSG